MELNCSFPLPATYSWTLNNDDLGVRGSALIVTYGTYACVASDADSKNFTASVFVALAPYFTGSPQSVQTRAGLSVELTCNVTGFPNPYIIWVKLESNSINKSVTPFSDITMKFIVDETMIEGFTDNNNMINVSILMLGPVEFNDFGYYACIAT